MEWPLTLDEPVEEVPSEDEALAVEVCEPRRASTDSQGQEAQEVDEEEEVYALVGDARAGGQHGGDPAAKEVVERLPAAPAVRKGREAGSEREAAEVPESRVTGGAVADGRVEQCAEAAPTGGPCAATSRGSLAAAERGRALGRRDPVLTHDDREEVCRAVDRVREAERDKRGLEDALARVQRRKAGGGYRRRTLGRVTAQSGSMGTSSAAAATAGVRGGDAQQETTMPAVSTASAPRSVVEDQGGVPSPAPAQVTEEGGSWGGGVDSRVLFLRELIQERSTRMQRAENEAESARHAHLQRMLQETEKRLSLFAQLDSAVAEATSACTPRQDAGR